VDVNYFDLIKQFIITFTGIFYEAMPWVILGSVLAGLVQELPTRWAAAIMVPVGVAILTLTILTLTPDPLRLELRLTYALGLAALAFGILWMLQPLTNRLLAFLGRHRILAIGASGLLGLVLPMCECGILAVMRRLYRKGMPLSCCTAYILAGPILNAVVLSTTFVAFANQSRVTMVKGQTIINFTGIEMVWLRGLLGYLVAFGTALLVEWMYRRHGSKLLTPEVVASAPPPKTVNGNGNGAVNGEETDGLSVSVWRRLSNVSETALHDIVDIGVYLIIGGLLASAIRLGIEFMPQGEIVQRNAFIAIAFMMGLAFLITLCSEADAFVASTFTSIAAAPKLAFLVLGPMLDIKLFLMYLRVFRPKLMWAIILAVVVQVFLYSSLTNVVWEHYAPQWFNLESVAK
jgi:uncharacterized membrane protein YraQ (UPF0718 family)